MSKSRGNTKFRSLMEPFGVTRMAYDSAVSFWHFEFLDRLVQIQYVESRDLYSFSLWFQGPEADDNFVHTMFHVEESEIETRGKSLLSEWFTHVTMKRVHGL